MTPLLTPEIEALLVPQLEAGTSTLADIAAGAGLQLETFRGWLRAGARGEPRYQRLALAVVAAKKREDYPARQFAARIAELLRAGMTLRGAAAELSVPYEVARVLVKRGRRGDPELAGLVRAAARRSQAAPRRAPTGPFVAEPTHARGCA